MSLARLVKIRGRAPKCRTPRVSHLTTPSFIPFLETLSSLPGTIFAPGYLGFQTATFASLGNAQCGVAEKYRLWQR